MPYKTIEKEFPEYNRKHESHMHELREKHKHGDKKMTEKLMGEIEKTKLEPDYD
jgi:hypothetical protein